MPSFGKEILHTFIWYSIHFHNSLIRSSEKPFGENFTGSLRVVDRVTGSLRVVAHGQTVSGRAGTRTWVILPLWQWFSKWGPRPRRDLIEMQSTQPHPDLLTQRLWRWVQQCFNQLFRRGWCPEVEMHNHHLTLTARGESSLSSCLMVTNTKWA